MKLKKCEIQSLKCIVCLLAESRLVSSLVRRVWKMEIEWTRLSQWRSDALSSQL